jgi:hypothetical protein
MIQKNLLLNTVLVVGSNPSQKSPDNSPFHESTASYRRIVSWFKNHSPLNIKFINLVDEKTEGNKPLKKSKIRSELENIRRKTDGYNIIIACGKQASNGLKMAEIDHFEMPHPSGRCRFWNDSTASRDKINSMLEYIYGRQGTNRTD